MILYRDSDYKLHVDAISGTTPIELHNFDGKCREYIEGHRYIPADAVWMRDDGMEFHGPMCTPWKPYSELDAAQREYERQLLAQYEAELADMKNALNTLGVTLDE